MALVTITAALRIAAASQLLLVVTLLLRDHRRSRITAASALLVACVVCYLLLPFVQQPGIAPIVGQLASLGALAVPFAFWLAARLYFDDSFRPTFRQNAVLLGLLATRALVLPWRLAAAGIAIAVVADGLRRIHAGASTDLLLSRLRLRSVVLLGTGTYALMVLVAEATLERGSLASGALSAANDIGLFLLVGAISIAILRVEPDLVRTNLRRDALANPPTILEKKLDRLVEEEQVFKIEGLTIGALAERLGEREYKVRQLINARLGFRNFGAFLSHFRVREACKLLADPAQRHLGVAEIAYGFGYSSLGPFNRAFKEIVGQTPTDYRKDALARAMLADSRISEVSFKNS